MERIVTHPFVQKVLLQLKEIVHSLFYTFQLQRSEDFDCEQKQSQPFKKVFQTSTVCQSILFASNARVVFLFSHC